MRNNPLPTFIKLYGRLLTIEPKKDSHVGTYKIEVRVSDGYSQPKVYEQMIIVLPEDTEEDSEDTSSGDSSIRLSIESFLPFPSFPSSRQVIKQRKIVQPDF